MASILITVLVGLLGGILAKRLKMPAPYMIGSMIAVAIVSITMDNMVTTKSMKVFAQIVSGAYIGQNVQKEDLKQLPKLGKTIILLMGLFTLNMVVMGLIFINYFEMTPVTAFLSCLPGGIMDVSLMAIDMGAQSDVVATIQTARLMGILVILPLWISFWVKRYGHAPEKKSISKDSINQMTSKLSPKKQWINNGFILVVATIGGMIGLWSGIPVGALIVSLLSSSFLKMTRNTVQMSPSIRYLAQICAGSIIGTSFTEASLRQMMHLIIPVTLLLTSYLIINVCYGFWMYKQDTLDLQSALFASSPAGATDLTLMAGELGGDMAKIAGIQITRILYTVIVMPILVKALLLLF